MTLVKHITTKLANLPSNDHRFIGLKQKLFFFNDLSQGSCFFLPRGAHIYNKLIEFLRKEYKSRNYEEVITPNIYNCQLWQTSGHWDHYKSNMIKFSDAHNREFSLKPMNCPGHCLMFKQQSILSSDQLPVRWADFGVLHRNELSGSLIGLSRVRRFQQDDAHIFCRPDQVESEVKNCLDFANEVYKKFQFTFDLRLSLRPEKYLGANKEWDNAEEALRGALNNSKLSWTENKNEGAFYGPKIDLIVNDQFNRSQQCATIQLDFQLPERFELVYKDSMDRSELLRPVIIHRAIFGSIERFIAMIAENCNGRWPFWLSPLQAQVIPIHENSNTYAKKVCDKLRSDGFWVDCDLRSSVRLNGKVREASLVPYNLILIVGPNEERRESVTVRIFTRNRRRAVIEEKHDKVMDMFEEKDSDNMTSVHNINIPLDKLTEQLKEYERLFVNRADLRLIDELDNK